MFKIGVLTRDLKSPTYYACKAACRVLTYLSTKPGKLIVYQGDKLNYHRFCDADWANDKDTRRSTSGNVTILCGGCQNYNLLLLCRLWRPSILPSSI